MPTTTKFTVTVELSIVHDGASDVEALTFALHGAAQQMAWSVEDELDEGAIAPECAVVRWTKEVDCSQERKPA